MLKLFVVIISCLTMVGCSHISPSTSHNQHLLADGNTEGYLTGEGMGYAVIADTNHYPGPRHVLDLADELQLSAQQRKDTQALFDQMQKDASELGEKLIHKEKIFHHLFRTGRMNDDTLAMLLAEMSLLETKIRYVHLSAHLKQKALLTPEQISRYDQLRGYSEQSATPTTH